jgi:type II secretory pathway pseudopilin PulG
MDVRLPDGTVIKNVPDDMTKEQLVSRLKASGYDVGNLEDKKTSTLPANAGLANLASSVAGLPADTIEKGINLVRAAQGTVAGAVGKTDWMPPMLKGSVGTSEWIRDKLRKTGEPGLSPDDPSTSPMGRAQFDLTSRGGFIPGLVAPAVGSMVAERLGGPEWAGVGAMAPLAAKAGYQAMNAPKPENFVKDQILLSGREKGYVVPPSSAAGGVVSKSFESLGGKAATQHQASIKNQQITNDLVRKELGLPKGAHLTKGAIEHQRAQFYSPYKEVSAISPQAKTALEQLKQSRHDATAHFNHYNRSADPAALAKAREAQAQASALETQLEQAAAAAGKPGLVDALRNARVNIAKTYDVERALNTTTGNIDASVLGRMVDKGRPLSGGLEAAGRFQQAFPKSMRAAEDVPGPGISALSPYAGAALGLGGYASLGLPGMAAAALPFTRPAARAAMLSSPVQNSLMPKYGPLPAPSPELLYQLGILQREPVE